MIQLSQRVQKLDSNNEWANTALASLEKTRANQGKGKKRFWRRGG